LIKTQDLNPLHPNVIRINLQYIIHLDLMIPIGKGLAKEDLISDDRNDVTRTYGDAAI